MHTTHNIEYELDLSRLTEADILRLRSEGALTAEEVREELQRRNEAWT